MAVQILPEGLQAPSETPWCHAMAKSPSHEELACAASAYPKQCNATQLGPRLEHTVLTVSVTGGLRKAAASTSSRDLTVPAAAGKGLLPYTLFSSQTRS